MTPDIGGFIALAALMVGLIGWLRADTIRRTDRIEKRLEEQGAALEKRLEEQGAALEKRLEEQMAALNERVDRMEKRLDGRMTRMEAVFNERMDRQEERMDRQESGIGDLRERAAHLNGMLDGLREAIVNATRRDAA